MRLIKYFMIIQLIAVAYFIIKSIMTPVDKMINIPSFAFYMLAAWAIFGTIYIEKILEEGRFKSGNKNKKSREDVSNLLMEISDKIMEKGPYNKSSVEFVKIATQYGLMDMKINLDLDNFLIEKIESYWEYYEKRG